MRHDASARRSLIKPEDYRRFNRSWLDLSIHRCFEYQAIANAPRPALSNGSEHVTYQELNLAANRLAHCLLEAIDPQLHDSAPIALLTTQGPGAVTAMLAILKAGQILAPLDQRMPVASLTEIVDRLAPAAVLTDLDCLDIGTRLSANRCPVVNIESPSLLSCADNPDRMVQAEAIACIYHTSGSTGSPKGVADSHCNVLHNIMRYTNSLGLAASDRMSLLQNPSFSGTVSTVFGALLNGATLVPRDLQSTQADYLVSPLGEWLERERITVFHGVPSIFRAVPKRTARYPALRLIRLEGDRSTAADMLHFQQTFGPRCVLVNGLGATECGLVCQYFYDRQSLQPADTVLPVGYAVEDTQVDIVDEFGRSLCIGETGEIIIKSAWLARGYWRNSALTDERFGIDQAGRRYYRTGDIGRLVADGCLVIHGRLDALVKVRGKFVDTAHVEAVLLSMHGVHHAVVRALPGDQGEQRLTAWVVARKASFLTPIELRQHAQNALPAASVPAAIIVLDALPLTDDGKLDARKLPKPDRQRPLIGTHYQQPETAMQRQIAAVWGRVLDIDEVGIDDSFIELGGDSLHAIRIAEQLCTSLDEPVSVLNLFELPSVRSLATWVESLRSGRAIQPDQSDRLGQSGRLGQTTQASLASKSGQTSQANDPSIPQVHCAGIEITPEGRDWPAHAIAVIGMAGRFPGAATVSEFWDNLCNSRESITQLTEDSTPTGARQDAWIRAYGLLEGSDSFDADFFGLTPREARDLDPQQRVWLECVLHALQDAGWSVSGDTVRTLRSPVDVGSIGVFAGARDSTYLWEILGTGSPDPSHEESHDSLGQLKLGNDRDTLALRTSYSFDFTGPSVSVQTACSTSLVSVAQACQSLAAAECDVAIAGGVCITFPQLRKPELSPRGIRSQDGHCRSFDSRASGTVFGDGAGVVVLKRIDDAMADGDRIDALIRGWSINNDGAHKASFAAPNGHAQTEVVMRAHRHAGVQPQAIGYIEAHGTATPVGDPIEFAALQRAFAAASDSSNVCGIGSVKSNIGHLDAAAGVAGLIKTVLTVRHGKIPASLNFSKPNPAINLNDSPLRVVDKLKRWPTGNGPRMAGVSSFGVGGTNCHLILQNVESPAASVEVLPESGVQQGSRQESPYRFRRRRFWHEKLDEKTAGVKLQTGEEDNGIFKEQTIERTGGELNSSSKYGIVGNRSELRVEPLLGKRLQLPASREIRFCVRYSSSEPAYLDDHRLFGVSVAPGASHLAMLAQAAPLLGKGSPVFFTALYLIRPLTFADDQSRDLQLVFKPDEAGWHLNLFSTEAGGEDWIEHLTGRAQLRSTDNELPAPASDAQASASAQINSTEGLNAFIENADSQVSGEDFYTRQWANQGGTGSAFRWLTCAWQKGCEALGATRRPKSVGNPMGIRLHPGLIEAACQVLHCCGTIETEHSMAESGITYVPFSVEEYHVYPVAEEAEEAWCHAILHKLGKDEVIGDLRVLSSHGTLMASIIGFRLRQVNSQQIHASASQSSAPFPQDGATVKPIVTCDATDSNDRIWQALQQYCVELLGHERHLITPQTNPYDIGFDSITALLLTNQIRQELGVTIDMSAVLSAESLAELSAVIAADSAADS